MLTGFLVVLPDVFFRVPVKRLLAAGRAKVVGLALILRLASRRLFVNIHSTHRIFSHRSISPLTIVI